MFAIWALAPPSVHGLSSRPNMPKQVCSRNAGLSNMLNQMLTKNGVLGRLKSPGTRTKKSCELDFFAAAAWSAAAATQGCSATLHTEDGYPQFTRAYIYICTYIPHTDLSEWGPHGVDLFPGSSKASPGTLQGCARAAADHAPANLYSRNGFPKGDYARRKGLGFFQLKQVKTLKMDSPKSDYTRQKGLFF